MECEKCGSRTVRTFRVVYEEGTRRGNIEGEEYESQTPLAKRCSPPEEPSFLAFGLLVSLVAIVIALKIGFFFESLYFGAFTFVLLVIGGYYFWRRKVAVNHFLEYERKLGEWNRSWMCLKCGSVSIENVATGSGE